MGRTRNAPDGGAVEDGAADGSPHKRAKKGEKGDKKVDKNLNKTTEALDDALADSLAEAATAEREPSAQTGKADKERRDLLEKRKRTVEARAPSRSRRVEVKSQAIGGTKKQGIGGSQFWEIFCKIFRKIGGFQLRMSARY
jgi:hypothetical protein